jgi:hypothetical protein
VKACLDDAAKGNDDAKARQGSPCGATLPVTSADSLARCGILLGVPNHPIPIDLAPMASERKGRTFRLLRQPHLARIHDYSGSSTGAGACSSAELVGADYVAKMVTCSARFSHVQFWARLQSCDFAVSAFSRCEIISILLCIQRMEAR